MVFLATISMASKLGKMVRYHEEVSLIKLLDPQSCGFVRSHGILNIHLHGGDSPINSHNKPLNICSREVT